MSINIIAMKNMADRFIVTMDSAVEIALFVHMPHKIAKSKQLRNNMYGINPSDQSSYITMKKYETKNIHMTNMVKDHLQYMSEQQ